MLACELAIVMPSRVSRLVLIDPVGLWQDETPLRNWMILPESVANLVRGFLSGP